MIETQKRNNMSSFLFLRAAVGFLQCLNSCLYSAYLIVYLARGQLRKESESSHSCDQYFSGVGNRGFYLLLIMSQFIDFSGLICCCYLFSVPQYTSHVSSSSTILGDSRFSNLVDHVFSPSSKRGVESEVAPAEPDTAVITPRKYRHHQATNQWAQCCQRVMRSLQIFSCNIFGGTHISQNESAFEVLPLLWLKLIHFPNTSPFRRTSPRC